ncbi:MAG: GNAT family N-acetyltransferase [Brumimicrobium sp.]
MNYKYEDNLQSERLITKFLTSDNVEDWIEFVSDSKSIAFFLTFVKGTPQEAAKSWIDKQIERYCENRFGLQAIYDRKTNTFLGQCGLLLQEIDGNNEVEIGYSFLRKYWGNGYAPEAAKLFFNYIKENKISDTVISIIDINNTNSQRVAEKNGFKRGKQVLWKEMEVYIYRKSVT